MKKHFTLLAGVLALGVSNAQVTKSYPKLSKAPLSIAEYDGSVSVKPQGTAKADGDLLYSDDFSVPANWTVGSASLTQGMFELGNNGSPGMTSVTQYMGAMASTSAGNGFAFFNGVQYLLGGAVEIQNTWVQSDTFDLSSATTIRIEFQQRYRAFNSDVTYVEFSEDGGVTWSESVIVNSGVVTNAQATQNTVFVDIPCNNTQYGVIRFRWENTDDDDQFGSGYGWCVDDLKIYQGYGNNLEISNTHSYTGTQFLQYTKFPISQNAAGIETQFDAEFYNKGYNSQNANLTVTSGSYNQTGSDVTVASFAGDTVAVLTPNGAPMPSTVGTYDYTFTLGSSNNTLQLTSDDAATMPFEMTNWIMAVDKFNGTAGSIDGTFTRFSTQSAGQLTGIGTLFEIFEDGEIGGVQVGIATVPTAQQANYNGHEFFATLLIYNPNTQDFEYVTETDPMVLTTSMYGKLQSFNFNNPLTVNAGDLYLVMGTSYLAGNGYGVPFAFSGYVSAGNTLGTVGDAYPADLTGLASDPATPTIVEAPVVRLDFQNHVGIKENTAFSGVSTYPNPFNNNTTVSFNLKSDSEVAVAVTDLAGRVVYTSTANMSAGQNEIAIDGSSFNAGVYTVAITSNGATTTQRIVKK